MWLEFKSNYLKLLNQGSRIKEKLRDICIARLEKAQEKIKAMVEEFVEDLEKKLVENGKKKNSTSSHLQNLIFNLVHLSNQIRFFMIAFFL